MDFIYTPRDVRKELESDPKHGAKWAFVLKEFDQRGFSLTVETLGFFTNWQASSRGVIVDAGAKDIAAAAKRARNGFREWACLGIQDNSIYFGEIARAWAKSQKDSCTKCLGSTVDFVYLFSAEAADADRSGGGGQSSLAAYNISSPTDRDMKGLLLWVFVDWWEVQLHMGMDHAMVPTDQKDLHGDYHDSQTGHWDEDQTHHFAFYFYIGIEYGAGDIALAYALTRTSDLDGDGNITNAGDYYLGITAAKLGDDFDDNPRYIGAEVTDALQKASPEKQKDANAKAAEKEANLWINPFGLVIHPDAPAGNGGPGLFASAESLLFIPEPGGLPHPNSPAARTLDPLKIYRYANINSQI